MTAFVGSHNPARKALARRALLEAFVVDEPTNTDRLDLLARVGGKGGDGHDGAQHGERGKRDSQSAIYN